MAAIIRLRGELATYKRETGAWACDNEFLEERLNRLMFWREPSLTHLEEVLDFERTAAKYVIDYFGQGEIVHIDPYWDEPKDPNQLDAWT